MKTNHATTTEQLHTTSWMTLEAFALENIQSWLQGMLEEELTELVGRERYQRRDDVEAACVHRNGLGKARRLSMSCGTITVRRPRVRGIKPTTDGAELSIINKTGETACTLRVDEYGNGEIGAWDREGKGHTLKPGP